MPKPTAPAATETVEQPSDPKKAADLTVNKVIAGAGAAATSAVLGSYFGATGTVAGAALGSVALTVSTTLYQRSLDRTRERIVARVQVRSGRRVDLSDAPTVRLTVPQPRVSPEEATEATTRLRVGPALRRPRTVWVWAGVTVLAFVLGLLAVTGIEWAKGSTLTTDRPGTSVGRVLTPGPGTDDGSGTSEAGEPGTDEPADRAGENPDGDAPDRDSTGDSTGDSGSDSGSDPGSDGSRDRAGVGDPGAGEPGAGPGDDPSTSSPEPTEGPTPTTEPDPDAGSRGDDSSGSEGAPAGDG